MVFGPSAHGHRLTQARWTTLLQIARGGDGMTQRQLADFMGIEAATLVPLLDSLSERQLVERKWARLTGARRRFI